MDSVKRSSGDASQRVFWDAEAATAQFSHPVDEDWLARAAKPEDAVLDYGCGYGRSLSWLAERGYSNLTGLDISEGMLARAAAEVPSARLCLACELPTSLDSSSYDLILLLAVLTGIPADADQEAVVAEVFRLLRPGGHVIVSDMLLQTDERRILRYRTARPEGLPYGTFVLESGGMVMRHHDAGWFDVLFSDFTVVDRKSISVPTMRGNSATITQVLLRRPPN